MDPGQQSKPDVLVTAEVAEKIRCHSETVYQLVHDGKLPAFRVGRHLRFRREDVEAFLAGAL